MKRPASQWYWADWLRDPAVRASSLAARGLWMDMMALMHEGEPYGHLTVGAEPVSPAVLARMVGESPTKVKKVLAELEASGVFSRTPEGVIYSRRLVRDEARRNEHADCGKLGGNPALGVDYNYPGFVYAMRRASDGAVKIGISASPTKRLYQIKRKHAYTTVELLATMATEDMGKAEAILHDEFAPFADGEWFSLPDSELGRLLVRLKVNPKENEKGKQTSSPSPSTSSSSATPLSDSPRAELLEKLPEDYRGDLQAFLRGVGADERQLSWIKSMDAHLTGLRMPIVTPEVLGASIRQFVGNGDRPNWRLFQRYLESEQAPKKPENSTGNQQHRNGKQNAGEAGFASAMLATQDIDQ